MPYSHFQCHNCCVGEARSHVESEKPVDTHPAPMISLSISTSYWSHRKCGRQHGKLNGICAECYCSSVAELVEISSLELHLLGSLRMVGQSRDRSHMTTSDHTRRQTGSALVERTRLRLDSISKLNGMHCFCISKSRDSATRLTTARHFCIKSTGVSLR